MQHSYKMALVHSLEIASVSVSCCMCSHSFTHVHSIHFSARRECFHLAQRVFAMPSAQNHGSIASIDSDTLLYFAPRLSRYVFSNASLVITGANNLVIDAVGATFVFYIGFGVVLNDCHNVTLRGLTLDSDPPNFAQGALVHGAGQPVATAMTFEAQFDDAFLAPDPRLPPFDHPGGLVGAKVIETQL